MMPEGRKLIGPKDLRLSEEELESIAELAAKHHELDVRALMQVRRRKKWEAALSTFVGKKNLPVFIKKAAEKAKQEGMPQHEAELGLLEKIARRAFPEKGVPLGEILAAAVKVAQAREAEKHLRAALEKMRAREQKKPGEPPGKPKKGPSASGWRRK